MKPRTRRLARLREGLRHRPEIPLAGFVVLFAIGLAGILPPRPVLRATAEALDLFPSGEPMIRVAVAALEEGRVHHVTAVGGLVLVSPAGQVRPLGRAQVAIGLGDRGPRLDGAPWPKGFRLASASGDALDYGGRSYPGSFGRTPEGAPPHLVFHVPLETYLEGVVAAEMGLDQAPAALEAQAVAARTYAARRLLARRSATHDVDASQRTQVYAGAPSGVAIARRAVRATFGLVLAHDGDLLDALYSSTCGGATRAAGEAFGGPTPPPLSGVPCGACEDAPLRRWTAETGAAEAARRLGLPTPLERAVILSHHPSGRLERARLHAAGRSRDVEARTLRRLFDGRARSTWITGLEVRGGHLVATGRGFGHGVGLCQYGARARAREGASFQAILTHYYPGARLVRVYDHPHP